MTFPLNDRAVSVWDVQAHAWSRVSGDFSIGGASSRDIRLTTKPSCNLHRPLIDSDL